MQTNAFAQWQLRAFDLKRVPPDSTHMGKQPSWLLLPPKLSVSETLECVGGSVLLLPWGCDPPIALQKFVLLSVLFTKRASETVITW